MTTPFDEQRYLHVLARWRMLAQRRLADLTQEYESGQWARYFDEAEILHLLREAKASVDIWMKISPPADDAPAVSEPGVLEPAVRKLPLSLPAAPPAIAA